MAYYLLLYHGDQIPDEASKRQEAIANWDRYTREIGNVIVDGGNLTVKQGSVTGNSAAKSDDQDSVTAYTIIEARNPDEALELSRGAPPLYESGGRADVYKIMDSVL